MLWRSFINCTNPGPNGSVSVGEVFQSLKAAFWMVENTDGSLSWERQETSNSWAVAPIELPDKHPFSCIQKHSSAGLTQKCLESCKYSFAPPHPARKSLARMTRNQMREADECPIEEHCNRHENLYARVQRGPRWPGEVVGLTERPLWTVLGIRGRAVRWMSKGCLKPDVWIAVL